MIARAGGVPALIKHLYTPAVGLKRSPIWLVYTCMRLIDLSRMLAGRAARRRDITSDGC